MGKVLLLLLLVSMSINLKGSEPGDQRTSFGYIGLRGHYGFIIPHAEKIRGISDSSPRGVELDLGWHLTGSKAWQYCFCYPRTGIMFSWFNYDNPEILGNSYILTPYIEPFFSAGRALSASVKTGIGVAYLDNIYDPVNNPLNHFYSTHFSFLVFLNFNLNYRVDDRINLRAGGYYNHISNGGNRQPNKGINFPTASLGLDYYFNSAVFPSRSRDEYLREDQEKSVFRVSPFFTTKEISKEDGRQYPVYGLAVKYSRLLGRLSAVSGGLEFASDGSLKERIEREGPEGTDHKRIALLVGHELLIGRFNFYQELGIYVYSPLPARDPVYQRYGLEFFVLPRLSAGASIKSHLHVADFLDARITYVF